jgi:murein L,D-transpeptidase YafK
MRTKKRMRTIQREERTGAVSCFPLDMRDKNMAESMSSFQTSVKWNIRNHYDNRLFSHRRKIETLGLG